MYIDPNCAQAAQLQTAGKYNLNKLSELSGKSIQTNKEVLKVPSATLNCEKCKYIYL